jgi:signal transduction histidine kinase
MPLDRNPLPAIETVRMDHMKPRISVPYERLAWFRDKVGLGEDVREKVNAYAPLFISKGHEFAESFHRYFSEIHETRIMLEHEKRSGYLKREWARWFEGLFREDFSKPFLLYFWNSGLRHVEVNVDQRYINLGFAVVRQFCRKIVESEVPLGEHDVLMEGIDKMIDYCLLIETHAYIMATSQCDMEVVKGISHQVRNPLTVIGGNIVRLKREAEPNSPLDKAYETILEENKRLEAMVMGAVAYSEMFQKTPNFSIVPLEALLRQTLIELRDKRSSEGLRIDLDLDPDIPEVEGDLEDLKLMFHHLLQNSLEALDPENPYIRVLSRRKTSSHSFAEIQIFNTGTPPNQEEINNFFVPFYSSKPMRTGFGLPIAQLAARKSLGELHLESVPGRGTRCIVTLPIPTPMGNELRKGSS